MTAFDLERRIVHAMSLPGRTDEYPYDSLIVAAGAGQSYFGHDEFATIAPGMKTIDDAMELRRRVFGALELAETMSDPALERFFTTFVVAGAGPTGVELAGQIRELAARSLTHDFRTIDPKAVRVVLVDGGKEPLANFGDRCRREPAPSSGRWESNCRWSGGSSVSTRSASTPKDPTAKVPDRVRHRHLGGRCPGLSTRRPAGGGNRRQDGPRRSDRRE